MKPWSINMSSLVPFSPIISDIRLLTKLKKEPSVVVLVGSGVLFDWKVCLLLSMLPLFWTHAKGAPMAHLSLLGSETGSILWKKKKALWSTDSSRDHSAAVTAMNLRNSKVLPTMLSALDSSQKNAQSKHIVAQQTINCTCILAKARDSLSMAMMRVPIPLNSEKIYFLWLNTGVKGWQHRWKNLWVPKIHSRYCSAVVSRAVMLHKAFFFFQSMLPVSEPRRDKCTIRVPLWACVREKRKHGKQ